MEPQRITQMYLAAKGLYSSIKDIDTIAVIAKRKEQVTELVTHLMKERPKITGDTFEIEDLLMIKEAIRGDDLFDYFDRAEIEELLMFHVPVVSMIMDSDYTFLRTLEDEMGDILLLYYLGRKLLSERPPVFRITDSIGKALTPEEMDTPEHHYTIALEVIDYLVTEYLTKELEIIKVPELWVLSYGELPEKQQALLDISEMTVDEIEEARFYLIKDLEIFLEQYPMLRKQ